MHRGGQDKSKLETPVYRSLTQQSQSLCQSSWDTHRSPRWRWALLTGKHNSGCLDKIPLGRCPKRIRKYQSWPLFYQGFESESLRKKVKTSVQSAKEANPAFSAVCLEAPSQHLSPRVGGGAHLPSTAFLTGAIESRQARYLTYCYYC